MTHRATTLELDGREVKISNPEKVFFPATGARKIDLVEYYLSVAEALLPRLKGRPMQLKRHPDGVEGEFFYQKRAPVPRPEWVETVEIRFPSGRTAQEVVVRDRATLAWVINLGCIDLHTHAVRADDLEHPDELRVDLDPVPGVAWEQIQEVAEVTRATLAEHGLTGWPKTSGSRGIHLYVPFQRRWTFGEVRRAALALARAVEERAPGIATSKWWKEERQGVFLDYNQNAKDRTMATAWSVRPNADARVSMPLRWEELRSVRPEQFTLASVPGWLGEHGDPWRGMADSAGSLDSLLALAEEQARRGQVDAPWPPHYAKGETEPVRAPPSKRRRPKQPLVEIARAAKKEEALAALDQWLARHPEVARHLQPADVLVDAMRGRSTTWTRIRVNLAHVPLSQRPEQGPLEVTYDPWA